MAKRSMFLVLALLSFLPSRLQAAPPADGWVVWQSNRLDSRTEVYLARADGTGVTRLTKTGANRPAWAPDGRWISYYDDAATIYVMRPDGSELQTVTTGSPIFWMHDNSGLLIQQGNQFRVFDPETKESTLLFLQDDFPQFAGTDFGVNGLTHDNRYLVLASHLYINGYTGANGSFTSEYSALIVDLLHKDKTYFLGSGCWPLTPPQGDLVFHICANCPSHPDIYRMSLADLDTRSSYTAEVAYEDADWGHEYNPRVSNDNRWMVYMASAGCHQGDDCDYDIWLHEIGAGPSERSRVTQNSAFDGYPQMVVGPLWQPTPQPRLLVTPNRVNFFASAGALPASQTLKIKNTGGGTLGPATLVTDPIVPWLSVRQDSTGITVGLNPGASLNRGTHSANLTVTVDGAVGSPVTVPVKLFADETFPYGDAGVPDASISSPALDGGISDDGGAAGDDDPDGRAPDSRKPSIVEADGNEAGVDVPFAGIADGGGPEVTSLHSSGCGCTLGAPSGAVQPLASVLLGLAMLVLGKRRRGR
jgi:hypothetical protein